MVATSPIDDPVPVSDEIMESVTDFIGKIRAMLPSQGLEAALGRSSEDIESYLEVLDGMFIAE